MSYRPSRVLATLVLTVLAPWSARADDRPPVEVRVLDDGDEARPDEDERAAPDERAAEEARLDEDAEHARQRIDKHRARHAEAAKHGDEEKDARDCHDGPWFWHKPSGVHRGDFLFTWLGGYGAGGGFAGGAAEWMFSEHFGLRLMGMADGLRADTELHGKLSGWNFTSDAWGLAPEMFAGSPHGFVGLAEPNITYHFRPGERFDVFASAGVSAFMYRLDEARGGSALVRTGLGAQWFWRALFVGAEVGWYPIEIARVTGRRESGVDVYRVDRPPEVFDGRRATFTAHVGIRL